MKKYIPTILAGGIILLAVVLVFFASYHITKMFPEDYYFYGTVAMIASILFKLFSVFGEDNSNKNNQSNSL